MFTKNCYEHVLKELHKVKYKKIGQSHQSTAVIRVDFKSMIETVSSLAHARRQDLSEKKAIS